MLFLLLMFKKSVLNKRKLSFLLMKYLWWEIQIHFFFSFTEMIDIIIETIGITDRRIEGHLMIGNGNIITQVDVGLLHPTQEVPQEGMYSIHMYFLFICFLKHRNFISLFVRKQKLF